MIAIQQLMITIGIVIASIVNTIIILNFGQTSLDPFEWRLALGVQCVPALLLAVVMIFMPESPRWLAEKGRDAEALEIIARLRSAPTNDATVVEELRDILDGVQFERAVGSGSWNELFSRGLSNRVAITIVMQFFQQWTGINVILYYQSELLRGMGLDPEQANIPFTIANNVVNCLATFPGMYLIEKMGRRSLLFYGGIVMGTAHYMICLFINLAHKFDADGSGPKSAMYYLAIFSVYIFLFGFASTWGPIAWVYQSEIFPLRVRGKGTGLATLSNWVNNAIIALIVPMIQTALDPNQQQMYLIFGMFC
jgi:sugar porter (SP) family MFS transporter